MFIYCADADGVDSGCGGQKKRLNMTSLWQCQWEMMTRHTFYFAIFDGELNESRH